MRKLVAICAVVTLFLSLSPAGASQFMSVNFDGDSVGSAPATGASGSPITQVGALGGYTATAQNSPPTADNGSIVVDNVAGMNKAAVLTTNPANAEVGALYMDTGLGINSAQVGVTFDIAVLSTPAIATAQGGFSLDGGPADKGVLFGLRTYSPTVSNWAFSFQVVPTSETGGVFAFRDGSNTQLTSIAPYVLGQKYSIALSSDYVTGTVNAYVNGSATPALSAYPLRGGALGGPASTSELFIYFNGESGYSNQIAIDNLNAYTNAVPEPASMLLLGLGGLLLRRRG